MPEEIETIHLDIGDGGATFTIADKGYGPEIRIRTSHYGNCENKLTIMTDAESLRILGEKFIEASKREFSPTYVYAARFHDSTGERNTADECAAEDNNANCCGFGCHSDLAE